MKKIILGLVLLSLSIPALADPGEHQRRGERYEHEHHGFGWGEFLGGVILGGIITHEVSGHYYDNDDYEVRRIVVCNNVPLFTPYGVVYAYQRQCHEEWVRINP
jgi:hypothetical protein